MKNVNNFTFKNISEFTNDDTIYIRGGTSQFPLDYLCQFVKYEKGMVHGTVLGADIDPRLRCDKLGEIISARLDRCSLYGKSNPNDQFPHMNWFDVLGYAGYELKKQPFTDKIPTTHPSYCTVAFSRTNSNGGHSFFGASVKPNSYISLKINQAKIKRDLARDYIHAIGSLIEVHFTEAQFAECITSLNMGSGTPATLVQLGTHQIPAPPFLGKVEQHSKEFANKMSDLASQLDLQMQRANTIINSDKPISKKEREELNKVISQFIMQVKSNIPFYEEQFVKQMDKTIHEAKMEIEQHLTNRAHQLGIPMVKQEEILSIESNKNNNDQNN